MNQPDSRRTLVLFLKEDQILLAMKKRGFGAGKWNGIGGKLDQGETLDQALIRECQEEVAMTPLSYQKVGEFDFVCDVDTNPWHMYVHTYICREWSGEPIETEEMAPQWFDITDIPYETMWADDAHWLPLVLAGDKVTGTFEFDEHDSLVAHSIQTLHPGKEL